MAGPGPTRSQLMLVRFPRGLCNYTRVRVRTGSSKGGSLLVAFCRNLCVETTSSSLSCITLRDPADPHKPL